MEQQEEPWRITFSELKSPIEDVIEEARNGRMFILVDDEDRENEGDLVIPAQMATPSAINFMAKYGRGLICLALSSERIEELGLPLMEQRNESRLATAFTVSIEAREGVTTGISAPDRARTVAVAIDPSKGAEDIVSPGHVFPLVARDGGVLVRTGHTEAAVDLARLAGLNPSGVICEIMNDDGTMARRDDLIAFAQSHGLKIATIADLIAYRRRNEWTIEREETAKLETEFGDFNLTVYRDCISGAEHIAVWKGKMDPETPVTVRVHVIDFLADLLGDTSHGKAGELRKVLRRIDKVDCGVLILIQDPKTADIAGAARRLLQQDADFSELRDYGVGAQILLDLGVRKMVVLSNKVRTIVGLEGYDLEVVGQEPIPDEEK